MTTASTSLQVTAGARWNAGQAFKAQGEWVQFPTLTELDAAIAATPVWYTGQLISLINEPPGTRRIWNGAHARNGVFPNGQQFTLAASTNVVLAATAFPTGGAAGDMAYNAVSQAIYLNTSGTWADTDVVPVTASRAFAVGDIGKLVRVTGSSAVVLNNPSTSIGYAGARPIRVEVAGTGAVTLTVSATLKYPSDTAGTATSITLPAGLVSLLTFDASGNMVYQG